MFHNEVTTENSSAIVNRMFRRYSIGFRDVSLCDLSLFFVAWSSVFFSTKGKVFGHTVSTLTWNLLLFSSTSTLSPISLFPTIPSHRRHRCQPIHRLRLVDVTAIGLTAMANEWPTFLVFNEFSSETYTQMWCELTKRQQQHKQMTQEWERE